MELLSILIFLLAPLTVFATVKTRDNILTALLTPSDTKERVSRQSRGFYDQRYGAARPLYDRLEYDRPSGCGRCSDGYEDDDYERNRNRYDDDRRGRPTHGDRYDRNKDDKGDDDRYSTDRGKTNGTNDNDYDKNRADKDRPGRRGSNRHRNRYDDRDSNRYDYYDRFLRDRERYPYERPYDRPYYDDPYRERRPLYDRYPYPNRYDEDYGRYDPYISGVYGKPGYGDRYERTYGYEDPYGGYGPGVGRGPHDRPWDETYRGQAGWDAGGRGYYFASGRPDYPIQRPGYATGWQSVYAAGYRDPSGYREAGYPDEYRPAPGYGQSSGWINVGERRPYRDQSGVTRYDNRGSYSEPTKFRQNSGQIYDQNGYGQNGYGQNNYGQNSYSQGNRGQTVNYGQSNFPSNNGQTTSSTPGTSYLYQREDESATNKIEESTKPSP